MSFSFIFFSNNIQSKPPFSLQEEFLFDNIYHQFPPFAPLSLSLSLSLSLFIFVQVATPLSWAAKSVHPDLIDPQLISHNSTAFFFFSPLPPTPFPSSDLTFRFSTEGVLEREKERERRQPRFPLLNCYFSLSTEAV
jgi:hypothetical protein